ncbi:MAG: zinc ribbon domain-containing protein [Candidatus Marinimicrobia bacterium]|nr:zinc ribbon domain-containing protein [Candidatus Neomarinimicrobiota bacterium]
MMPVYTYHCECCGNTVKRLFPIIHHPPECCNCEIPMKREIKSVGFILKGNGFHNTDYTHHGPKRERTLR